MSQIYELFGYPLEDKGDEAESHRRNALCPFMGKRCDGGGNRPQSNISLKSHPALATYFQDSNLTVVPSGICSLQLSDSSDPWIVCPRRLLFLGDKDTYRVQQNQQYTESVLLKLCDFVPYSRVGVWQEVKIKYSASILQKSNERIVFDYTFDYVLMPLEKVMAEQIEQNTGLSWQKLQPILKQAGYTLLYINNQWYVEDFPSGSPVIIEIMTSSTSGGNKSRRSTIPMAFEDALLRDAHAGPSINYRQVWARMVSQLIVKSEVGLAWGGKTIWVLQNTLAKYISQSTALNLNYFLADETSEVNILSLGYDSIDTIRSGISALSQHTFYAGPIKSTDSSSIPSFQDIIHTAINPPLNTLFKLLVNRRPIRIFQL